MKTIINILTPIIILLSSCSSIKKQSKVNWINITAKKHWVNVNTDKETWKWKNGLIHCSGKPIGVLRSVKEYKNFELKIQWRHLKNAGNSGLFIWVPKNFFPKKKNSLPSGIEIQMLDHGYAEYYTSRYKKSPNWFTTHGDVFSVGKATIKPFPPTPPKSTGHHKRRSFPKSHHSYGYGKWNSYFIRCINGEVRLSVNGVEVSGGKDAKPSQGYLALESEASPIEFKNILIKELKND